MKGVIEKATGDLLRIGDCDWENDGSFDSNTEEVRSDVPDGAIVRGQNFPTTQANMSRWNGNEWVEVPQP